MSSTSSAPPLFATPTTTRSSSAAASASSSGNPYYGGSTFDGGNPPSIYLICFVVIICLLLGISLFVAGRALLLRRRLHRAWAATGYSDTFFENNPTIAALHGVQGWGAGGWGANQVRKREKRLGKRPDMWEVEMPAEEEEEQDGGLAVGEKRALTSADWDGLQPISVRLLKTDVEPTAEPLLTPSSPPRPSPPTFLQTLRGPPVRPPQTPTFFAAPTPTAPAVEQTLDALSRRNAPVEVSVLIRLPVNDEEQAKRKKEREAWLADVGSGAVEDDDDGEDLPELWIATERVDLL